ncbi:MAG TPA: hypothetical protein VE988_08935, partial [Gemmataceae bacterium]|nr:hypothetical protein [Gemmataceae bacterium]
MNRNTWLGTALGIVSFFLANAPASAQFEPITLSWLEGPPQVASGVSWGVPWPQGKVKKDQTFQLTGADGTARPLQSWPLAYWPDGSMKWIGFATVVTPQMAGPFKLAAGAGAAVDGPKVQVKTTKQTIEIDTGGMVCKIPAQGGADLFESIVIRGRTVAANGRLECISQNGPDVDPALPPAREKFVGNIKKVTVEQSGPVRAVVKFEGMHKSTTTKREWLPFTVRLYFSAGDTPVRMVHTFFFDGDEKKDFIRGLGVTFSVPFAEEIQNRHVRLSGEDAGLWAEPIQPLTGYQRSITYPGGGQVYNDQIAGKRMPNRKDLSAANQQTLDAFAMWDNYRLIQPNAQGFTIEKQTGPKSSWVIAGAGKRSTGYAFVGDVSGGLGVGVKDFWQSYPASLEVRRARSKAADLRVWLWSPDAPAMDMRHYDTIAHGLNETYEDVEEGFSTPLGIARTSSLTLFPKGGLPTKQDTAKQVQTAVKPPWLVCTPAYLHSVKAFGLWSLQDRSTDFKKGIEDILDGNIAFFQKEVEQRNWYGFWDYGDVMHGYDATRHVWKYDIGGFAWDNSEQGTDMWLWYSFLRTGRADIFRMAEAMTRHTGE